MNKENIFNINNNKMIIPLSKTDGIFINLRKYKVWEPNLSKVIKEKHKLFKIDTFIDIGAHIGYYTLLLAKNTNNVYSFEPNINNYNLLKNNIELNNFTNCNIFNIGLSNTIEQLTFYYNNLKSGHGSFNKETANINKLNLEKQIDVNILDNIDILGDNIMIKIDIEGHEYNCLNGMIKLLETKKIKVLIIEISRKFYGIDHEKEILTFIKKYFNNLYIVNQSKYLDLTNLPNLNQYDLCCY